MGFKNNENFRCLYRLSFEKIIKLRIKGTIRNPQNIPSPLKLKSKINPTPISGFPIEKRIQNNEYFFGSKPARNTITKISKIELKMDAAIAKFINEKRAGSNLLLKIVMFITQLTTAIEIVLRIEQINNVVKNSLC